MQGPTGLRLGGQLLVLPGLSPPGKNHTACLAGNNKLSINWPAPNDSFKAPGEPDESNDFTSLLMKLKKLTGTSLVAQWLRIRLPMQGTQVRALVREDPTCHGATKPVRHNY